MCFRLWSSLRLLFVVICLAGWVSGGCAWAADVHADAHHPAPVVPHLVWTLPFVALLLAIALLPLFHATEHWWHHNRNKLIVALALAAVTLVYYAARGTGFAHGDHASEPGLATAWAVLQAALHEYIPFMVLLFSLFVISGGIRVSGDFPAHPLTNTTLLGIGAGLASFIGTTGASMLLIRLVLDTNRERRYKVHTIVFFIFLVSNIGGCLLPIGDPPLFLGYLKHVPFLWTMEHLWRPWLFMVGLLLAVYYVWDRILYARETPGALIRDELEVAPLRVEGAHNLFYLAGVVFCTGTLSPGRPFLGTGWEPFVFCRELLLLVFVALSLLTTKRAVREANQFNYVPIGEVACLFIGIFITMQTPIEILRLQGPALGLAAPWEFFWSTGLLSSFLDNAPTYVVFFETAGALTDAPGPVLTGVLTQTGGISVPLLIAVSLGAVFMGANTYIGNGPNFMVKSIAEQSGVKMPSFFGYLFVYSLPVLGPLFAVFTLIFLR